MATYLVTGGAGFIGSNIVGTLVGMGETVRVLDNLSTGKLENLADVTDQIDLVQGSILDRPTVERCVAGVDYVLHQAAIPSVPRSIEDPLSVNETNVRGTLQLLLAARDARVKRFVFASSSSVYGESEELPKREDMPTVPMSPYGVSKLAGEAYCRAFCQVYGLPTVVLRYFNVFGPHQDPTSQYAAVIPLFISALLRGERPTVFGDGSQSRDFCFINNVVDANLLACRAPRAVGETFNIACGRQHTLIELLEMLNSLIGAEEAPEFAPPRPGDIKHSLADIGRARHLIGYEAKVGFHEGLTRTVMWYRSQV